MASDGTQPVVAFDPVSKRGQQLLIVGVLAAVIVVVAVVLSSSGSDSDSGPAADSAKVEKLFAGIPQKGVLLGDPDAPEKLIEFVDMQCPYCAEFTRNSIYRVPRELGAVWALHVDELDQFLWSVGVAEQDALLRDAGE